MIVDKPLDFTDILADENERARTVLLLNNINKLLNSNTRGSVCVAVSGDWGSGKTTYLKALESYYGAHAECPVLFFEAWKHQDDENPLVPLILSIKDIPSLKPDIMPLLEAVVKPLLVSTIAVSDIVLNFFTKKGIHSIERAFEFVENEKLALKSNYRENIKVLQKAIEKITDGRKQEDKRELVSS